MKMKVSDYVAKFLVEAGIDHVFTVTGGGAMHLNDSLGHQEGLKCVYNHHEQAYRHLLQDVFDVFLQ